MTRDEFKKVAEQALEQLVSTAEQRLNFSSSTDKHLNK